MQHTHTNTFRINKARAQGWGDRAEAFVMWQAEMGKHVSKRLGLSIHDLPDWDFASVFTSGESAEDAAKRFIEDTLSEGGFDLDEFDL